MSVLETDGHSTPTQNALWDKVWITEFDLTKDQA